MVFPWKSQKLILESAYTFHRQFAEFSCHKKCCLYPQWIMLIPYAKYLVSLNISINQFLKHREELIDKKNKIAVNLSRL